MCLYPIGDAVHGPHHGLFPMNAQKNAEKMKDFALDLFSFVLKIESTQESVNLVSNARNPL